jgi:enoyl-CoA hydratase
MELITTERRGDIWLMGLHRPAKRNAFTRAMLDELGSAYTELDRDPDLRCGVLFAHGDHFTAGIDLSQFGPHFLEDPQAMAPGEGLIDPLAMHGPRCRKPLIVAIQGICFTIGLELMLAADIRIAAPGTRFAQLEVQRGLYPLCGATFRMPAQVGWGNAMRWLLTGDEFDATEAHRIGLVQEIHDQPLARAVEIAHRISKNCAPLAVQATIGSALVGRSQGEPKAVDKVREWLPEVAASEDFQEGIRSFTERRKAEFKGR